MEEANKRDADEKAKHGGSHIDQPIAIENHGGLDIPKMPEQPKSDVLEEWKRVADQGRMKAAKEAVDEENAAPAPEVVPMVQPIRAQEVKQDPNLEKTHRRSRCALLSAPSRRRNRDILTITAGRLSLYNGAEKARTKPQK